MFWYFLARHIHIKDCYVILKNCPLLLHNTPFFTPDNFFFLKACFLWTVVLEKTPESPYDNKEIKPVKLKGNQLEYSLKGLMLSLKLQYSGYLIWTAGSLEKSLMLGKIEGRRRGHQRICLDGIIVAMNMNLGKLQKTIRDRGHKELDMTIICSDQFSRSVVCLTLCDLMDCSTPGLPVHHQLPEFTQIYKGTSITQILAFILLKML